MCSSDLALTYNKVYNYACHYLQDTYLAQDAVQEVYILVLKNITTLNDPLVFISWLNQICFRVCFDLCKKRNQNYGVLDDETIASIKDENEDSNPEDSFCNAELRTHLKNAIDHLPLNEQQAIILRYFNNMKIDTIANAMDLSKSTVKRYLISAKNHLQAYLHEYRGCGD